MNFQHSTSTLSRLTAAQARLRFYGPGICISAWRSRLRRDFASQYPKNPGLPQHNEFDSAEVFQAQRIAAEKDGKRIDASSGHYVRSPERSLRREVNWSTLGSSSQSVRQSPPQDEEPRHDLVESKSAPAIYERVFNVVASFESVITAAAVNRMRGLQPIKINMRGMVGPLLYTKARSPLDSVGHQAFDESKHERVPAGNPDGGQFTRFHATSRVRGTDGAKTGTGNAKFTDRLDFETTTGRSKSVPPLLRAQDGDRNSPVTEGPARLGYFGEPVRTDTPSEVQLAGLTTPGRAVALLVPGVLGGVREVIGHHPLPIEILKEAYVRGKIDVDSFKLGTETYFKDPGHGNKTYGEVPHKKYSAEVGEELDKLVKANKGKPIDKNVMESFLQNLTEGKGANGKPNPVIKDFNDAVLGVTGDAFKKTGEILEKAGARDIDEVIRRCDARRAFWANRYMGAALAGATGFLGANAEAAITAVGSEHLRRAVEHLNEGNIREAESEIFGPDRSGISGLIAEIENNGSPLAAQNAKKAFEELFTRLPSERDDVARLLEGKARKK